MRTGSRYAAGAVLGMALIVSTGCDQGLKEENAQLRTEVEQMTLASAERDSLLQIVVDNTQLMSEINAEISKVKGLKSGVVPVTNPESGLPDTVNAKTYLLDRVKEVTARINESEERLQTAQTRLARVSKESDQFRSTVEQLQSIIDTQKVTMLSLTEQINALQTENVRLVQEKQALTDTVVTLAQEKEGLVEEQNTAYYVIGTKDELKEMGVITEEGSKFLFFGGTSLHPSRNLTPDNFTRIDLRETTVIPLPEIGQKYK
ncbi:MAG: hypothetical protein ACREL6_07715, partial [Gemmatimonadales bacterium]